MRILAIHNGDYGRRHFDNVHARRPDHWTVLDWEAPTAFPLVIDYPEDFLPETLPSADLILAFGEHRGVAELIPDIARMTFAQAVIAAVDNEAWLPRGLARQLHGWLQALGVVCVTPKPLCSLTETDYLQARGRRVTYDHPLIAEFATYFGQPDLQLTIDPETRRITQAEVRRDAVCGCARFVAQGLVGLSADEAEQEGGLRHHHYPCLASMGIDADFGDTLMHISGHLLKENILDQVRPFKQVRYIQPGTRSGPDEESTNPSG